MIEGNARAVTKDFDKVIVTGLWHISGQIINNDIGLYYNGKIKHILIEFAPLGLYQLLGIRGDQAVNNLTPPDDLNPDTKPFFDDLTSRSSDFPLGDIEPRLQMLERALIDRIPYALEIPEYLITAVNELDKKNGAIKESNLIDCLDVAERQFNRKFTEIVGISPKYYAKIVQVNRALLAMLSNEKAYLAEVAQQAGFYDQAHFVNVMKTFLKKSPNEFLQSDEHMLFDFLGRSR